MKNAVVIPNWNGGDIISECIESLQNQTSPATIVVVDNGSVDNSVELIEKNFPKVILLKQKANLGFAGGVNVGIRYALEQGANAIALFNNDAAADKDWLNMLAEALEANQTTGIVTGKLLRNDKIHLDSAGEYYSIWGMPFPRGRNQKDHGQFEKQQAIFAASGGASLYRAKMLKEIGLFDEKFFAYFEDVDLCFRAQLAGWKVIYEPGAIAYHRIGATSGKLGSFVRYHTVKNFYMLYFKNMPGLLFLKYLPFFWLQAVRLAVSSTLKGGLLSYLRAKGRLVLNLPYVLKQRRQIQKRRQISVKKLDELLYHHRPPKTPAL